MPKQFHLAWFTNFTAGNWSETFSHGGSPWDGKFFVEFAQAMERACFDYMILEDTLMVSDAWGGTAEMSLGQALQVPKHDPVPLAAMIAAATSRLGIVATMSTLAWPPFMLARVSTTIRPHRGRPVRLEHRHQWRGRRRTESRPRQIAAA
ncbi:MAG: LLM class flavin-dependent oxidoreductase [Stellaceae bacterium]